MRHYKGVVLKVGLRNNITLDRQRHLSFKLTNDFIEFIFQTDALLSCIFFRCRKSPRSLFVIFPDFFKGKWQRNIDNMINDIINILETETRTTLYCAMLQCSYTTLHYRLR